MTLQKGFATATDPSLNLSTSLPPTPFIILLTYVLISFQRTRDIGIHNTFESYAAAAHSSLHLSTPLPPIPFITNMHTSGLSSFPYTCGTRIHSITNTNMFPSFFYTKKDIKKQISGNGEAY